MFSKNDITKFFEPRVSFKNLCINWYFSFNQMLLNIWVPNIFWAPGDLISWFRHCMRCLVPTTSSPSFLTTIPLCEASHDLPTRLFCRWWHCPSLGRRNCSEQHAWELVFWLFGQMQILPLNVPFLKSAARHILPAWFRSCNPRELGSQD